MRKDKVRAPTTTKFVYKERHGDIKTILLRLLLLVCIFLFIALLIYSWNHLAEHPHYIYSADEGLPANQTRDLTYIDCVYFTVISVTTTGYGDIVPVTETAKVFDTIIITLGRAITWFIIISTAYQFVYQRYRDVFRMKAIQRKLNNHVIVCGYEVAGRTAAQELHHKGIPKTTPVW